MSLSNGSFDLSEIETKPTLQKKIGKEELKNKKRNSSARENGRSLHSDQNGFEGNSSEHSQDSDTNHTPTVNNSQHLGACKSDLGVNIRESVLDNLHSEPVLRLSSSGVENFQFHNASNFKLVRTKGQIEFANTKESQSEKPDASSVFFGKLPSSVSILELAHLFETVGPIQSVRLMLNPITGESYCYGFATFLLAEHATAAIAKLSGHMIRPGRRLVLNAALQNKTLFVGNIKKTKSRDDLLTEFSLMVDGLVDVIVYRNLSGELNRGFCFLEFESRASASRAKNVLSKPSNRRSFLIVDWADPTPEPSEAVMNKVKRVYVSNLSALTSEEILRETFEAFGAVERVKKIDNYAFIHYEERRCALKAIEKMNEALLDGEIIKVMLSKPPLDKITRQATLQKRERRMKKMFERDRFYFDHQVSFNSQNEPCFMYNGMESEQHGAFAAYSDYQFPNHGRPIELLHVI